VNSEKNYYRLRSVDLNGREELSNVILIKMQGISQKVFILGNPFNHKIMLKLFKEPVTGTSIRLIDIAGKLVAQKQFGSGVQVIDWDMRPYRLNAGIYYLKVTTDGAEFTHKLVKQ
jgi:hypothetical protein